MQADAAIGIGALSPPIFKIALDGTPPRFGQLAADLMVSPGLQSDLQQKIIF